MALTKEEIIEWEKEIDNMTQREMANLWRHSASGHPIFDKRYQLFQRFQERFAKGIEEAQSIVQHWEE